jgi:hypothetical protein
MKNVSGKWFHMRKE